MSVWKMPEEFKQYESFIRCTAGYTVEELMSKYNSGSADLLASAGSNREHPDSIKLLSLLVNEQLGLIVALKAAGLLKDPPPCPLQQKGNPT